MNQTEVHELDAREQLARLAAFLRRAARLWPIPLATLLVAAIVCAGYLRVRKARYRSETVVLYIEKGSTGDSNEPASASRTMTMRLKEILLSRPTLERQISTFDLYPELRRELGLGEAVEELKKHVEFRAPGGDTISIAFEGSSPSEAQRVTAALAQNVIDGDAELRRQQARVALDFLLGEKTNTETQLRSAEQALASFMAQHPRFALDATPLASGTAIRASLADGKSATAGGEPSRFPAAGSLLGEGKATGGGAAPGTPAAQTPEARAAEARARAALATARENLTQLLAQYTPAHPDVRAAQAELAHASERLAAIESNAPPPPLAATAGGEQPAAAAAPRRAWSPPPAAAAPRPSDTKELVALETQWLKLTQAVTEAHERQDQVDAQWFKADMQASSESAGRGVQVSVIDPAFLPQREQPPGRTLLAGIFALAGLLLGVVAALIGAAFDDRLLGAVDLTGISLLAEIPAISRAERRPRGAT